ncbi:MAG: ATP-binding cassette domain-containing protein [Spirochaetota bacterium]
MTASDPLLEVRSVSVRFAANDVLAVDRMDLELHPAEVHAIIGENGAGKSTLMQVIAGALTPTSGSVVAFGRTLPPADARAARDAGVVLSYQHPRLDRMLSVLENLFLGDEPVRWGLLFDRTRARARVASVAPDFTPAFLRRRLGTLSSGQVRLVSVVAALMRLPHDRPGVLILDEPTEASTPDEVEVLFDIIRRVAAGGHAVLFISHRLPEVERIADTVTVMRAGRAVATFREPVGARELAHAMVGGESAPDGRGGAVDLVTAPTPNRPPTASGRAATSEPPRLLLTGLVARRGERVVLDHVDLALRAGEIVGLTGIRENGIEALEELLAGRLRACDGTFEVLGVDARGRTADQLRRLGLRYVPTDRLFRGASLSSSVSDNLIALRRRDLQRGGFLDHGRAHRFAAKLRTRFGIDGGLSVPLWQLSGGNLQKVILSRELEGDPQLVVICEPSWGLDFVSRARIADAIRGIADEGASVLVLSTDIDEILALSTRIGVLYDGRIVGTYDCSEVTRDEIGRAMVGTPTSSDAEIRA